MENLLEKARELAGEILKDEVRSNGAPFFEHPEEVARIVGDEIGLPVECCAAVYLHEATRKHPEVDISAFPDDVRTMVDGLNKISTIRPKDTKLEAENYKKLIVKYSTDPRVAVLKIADRLEIMRNLNLFTKTSREQKLLETLMLYIPLAHQLGMYNIKSELENIYFMYTEPEEYRAITNKLKATQKDRVELMQEFIEPLKKRLTDAGISYKLKIRTKTAYSIFKKMRHQNVPFEGVYDVFAMRFIIDCEPDPVIERDLCWKVYSYVTEEYEPDTSRLRDWLTNPKPNGYESLHITVRNVRGKVIEVQIRTARMDSEAETGSAAHWVYKGIRHEEYLDRWLKSVRFALEHPCEGSGGKSMLQSSSEIFVFTPTGELRVLPPGASVLDFAFNIHSGLGCKCTGGRIGGRAVSIREKLNTGDVVEILTSKNQKPSRDWLGWVVSSKARTKIKQELDAEERKKAAEGREILERRLKNWKLEFPDEMRKDYMKSCKYQSGISFLAAIAEASLDLNDIKAYILKKAEESQEVVAAPRPDAVTEGTTPIYKGGSDILVLSAKDVKGLDCRMAHCCNPVFGDDVFGFVTRTAGIKIHRISCPNASRLIEKYPYRIQKVIWQETAEGGTFQTSLNVTSEADHSVVNSIMGVVSQFKASIRALNVNENAAKGLYDISLRLLVPSNTELDKVVSQISVLKQVIRVKRV